MLKAFGKQPILSVISKTSLWVLVWEGVLPCNLGKPSAQSMVLSFEVNLDLL